MKAPVGNANQMLLQPFRSENRSHFQNALVILLLLKFCASLAIDNESYITMKLQRGGGNRGGKRPFNRLGDSCGFGGAAGQQKNSLGFENGSDAHGDGTLRNLVLGGEESTVVLNGLFA